MKGAPVAVIGAGDIGGPIARRLCAAGFMVTVCDRDERRLDALRGSVARTTDTASDCAGADVALLLVANGAQVRDAVLGPRGLASEEGPLPAIVVMSTVAPRTVTRLAVDLASRGAHVMDAPVSGGAARADNGTLTIMVGGEAVDSVRPILEALAARVIPCGPLGSGQFVKILNNIVCHSNTVLLAEAFALAARQGLDPAAVAAVLEVSTGRNYLTAEPERVAAAYSGFARDRPSFDALLSIMRKDLRLAVELASAASIAAPMLRALAASASGLGDETYLTWTDVGGDGWEVE